MYVDIFSDDLVRKSDIVGIFDLDNTTIHRWTNDFLKRKQDEEKITYLFSDIPKSFILMSDGSVYVVEHSSRILRKRFELI